MSSEEFKDMTQEEPVQEEAMDENSVQEDPIQEEPGQQELDGEPKDEPAEQPQEKPAGQISSKAVSDVKKGKDKSGAHSKAGQSEYINKSSRMRTVLIVVVVVLILLAIAIGFFAVRAAITSGNSVSQQDQIAQNTTIQSDEPDKDASTTTRKTTVPNLVNLLGHNTDECVTMLAHGAQVTGTLPINEEGNPIKNNVSVALTEEAAGSRTGTPTVYLSLNEEGSVIKAGYSVSTSSLGYGSMAFTDIVVNQNIIEKTLSEAGLQVDVGSVKLPEDKMQYSTYGTDGTTLVKEQCSFQGTGMASGQPHGWEASLTYDYTMANATDNLSNTVRTIFIYVS